jgi:hypothetical protein
MNAKFLGASRTSLKDNLKVYINPGYLINTDVNISAVIKELSP